MSYIALAQNTKEDYLEAHNKARAEVGVDPLKWNDTLAAYALKYGHSMIPKNCEMEHSMGPYGENLAGGSGAMSGRDAVNMWVGEKPFYDPNSGECVDGCLHYTQVVWRSSTDLGCARVKCLNDAVFIICNYYPIGNVYGEKPY
ncbi:hypothetical protein RJT34_04270 [Clitoria ternatea]|uniref:SCP domain-containing protein n=1 Tax=Clitoria ternatea TaxID=43366 RepID=A0AAN9Q5Y7_CLITE